MSIFDHNTGFCTNAFMVSDGSPKTNLFVFQNNLVSYATYGFIGSGTGTANSTLAMYFNPNWSITKNAIIGGTTTGYPVENYFPANISAVGFVDYNNGNYHLTNASPYKNLGTDGKDLGADIDSISIMSTYSCDTLTSIAVQAENLISFKLYPSPANENLIFESEIALTHFAQLKVTSYNQLIKKEPC